MTQESSNQSKTTKSNKGYAENRERFVSPRMFAWPLQLFVEIKIDPAHPWKVEDEITPIWFTNGRRVLIVNWTLLEKWKARKWKPRTTK